MIPQGRFDLQEDCAAYLCGPLGRESAISYASRHGQGAMAARPAQSIAIHQGQRSAKRREKRPIVISQVKARHAPAVNDNDHGVAPAGCDPEEAMFKRRPLLTRYSCLTTNGGKVLLATARAQNACMPLAFRLAIPHSG